MTCWTLGYSNYTRPRLQLKLCERHKKYAYNLECKGGDGFRICIWPFHKPLVLHEYRLCSSSASFSLQHRRVVEHRVRGTATEPRRYGVLARRVPVQRALICQSRL